MSQEIISGPITGYKATNIDMTYRGYKFNLGEIHEIESEEDLQECSNGFDFCIYPSGVHAYYSGEYRVFKIKAFDVLRTKDTPGSDCIKVCRKIQFIEEIEQTGDGNTGDGNTGDLNTGDGNTGYRNTGYRNTGDGNTGDLNTGDWNTGYRNTGYWNTGYRNTGDLNTGYWNTGYRNTGDWNTGYGNTGYRNTGDLNTGYGNVGDRFSGHFNSKPIKLRMFDKYVSDEDSIDITIVNRLADKLSYDIEFDVSCFLSLPNATEAKIKALHKKHIKARADIQ